MTAPPVERDAGVAAAVNDNIFRVLFKHGLSALRPASSLAPITAESIAAALAGGVCNAASVAMNDAVELHTRTRASARRPSAVGASVLIAGTWFSADHGLHAGRCRLEASDGGAAARQEATHLAAIHSATTRHGWLCCCVANHNLAPPLLALIVKPTWHNLAPSAMARFGPLFRKHAAATSAVIISSRQ